MKINQAFILAAGYGTRMRPITHKIPKPMVEVNGRSIITRTMDSLIEYGVKKIVINTFYKKELLTNHVEEYIAKKNNAPDIRIIEEQELLETGGGIINALRILDDEPFFVANSDSVFLGPNVFTTLNSIWTRNMTALFLLTNPNLSYGYLGKGDFSLDDNDQLMLPAKINYPFPGIHITQPKTFSGLLPQAIKLMKIYDTHKDVNTYKNFYGHVYQGKWFHVDTPEALENTNSILQTLEI